jgi:GT2 family glycosyltransferase
MDPLISIIVVNYNGLRFLGPCLSSLVCQTCREFEIIVVDNASSDGSADYVRKHFPSVILVESGNNRGFAGGVNAGVARAGGEFILTLNTDIVADPRLLEEIIKPMIHDPGIGMCATKMLFPDGKIYSTGIVLYRSGAAIDRGIYEQDTGEYDREDEVFGPCGGAALYRRSLLDEIGLFDEDFFLYVEDVDLACRARLSGWKCRYVPGAKVIHEHGGTTGVNSDLSLYYTIRNQCWCAVKNLPLRIFLRCLPWILVRYCVAVPLYALKGRGRVILTAETDTVRGLSVMIRKRRTVVRKVPDAELWKWIQT